MDSHNDRKQISGCFGIGRDVEGLNRVGKVGDFRGLLVVMDMFNVLMGSWVYT